MGLLTLFGSVGWLKDRAPSVAASRGPVSPAVAARLRAIAGRRAEVLSSFRELVSAGVPAGRASRAVGASRATLWRWGKALEKGGSLEPGTWRCGRRSVLEKFGVTAAMVAQVRVAIANGAPVTKAWHDFGQSIDCPPGFRSYLLGLKPRWALPPSLKSIFELNTN